MSTGRPFRIFGPTALVVAWSLLVAAGFGALLRYEKTAGELGEAPATWPRAAALPAPTDRPVLVLAAHPRCPCTRATLQEFEKILARCGDRLRAEVLFYDDPLLGEAWPRTDLWDRASAVPGVAVHRDSRGAAARSLGARTSGHCVLYGADGRLLFSGGITAGRGHVGANAGAQAVLDRVLGGRRDPRTAPVFGCPLGDLAGEETKGVPR